MPNCIVIGAGPGGLVCTKELLEAGITDVVCLEKDASVGGIFKRSYDSLYLTSSAAFSMFSDFWIGDGKAHEFWTKAEVVDYWTCYADHFGVTEKIRFGCNVSSAAQSDDGRWTVTLDNGDRLQADHLLIAPGNNIHPVTPDWASRLGAISYVHACDYKNADAFVGKNVLIVGGGESASDIALEISKVAAKCSVSLRNGTGWVVPRERNGNATDLSTHRGLWTLPRDDGAKISRALLDRDTKAGKSDPAMAALAQLNKAVTAKKGIWGTYGTKSFSLPRAIAEYGCQIVGEVTAIDEASRTLTCADGKKIGPIDCVVFATGYRSHVPFLDAPLADMDPRALFKHMIHPDIGLGLFWIGFARPTFGSQFPIMEMQARYCAQLISGRCSLPAKDAMIAQASADKDRYLDQFEATGARVRGLVDYFGYMDQLAALVGCAPPLWRYAFTRPRLWRHLVYGPAQATQFRLEGPGAKPELARDFIMKIPTSPLNKVVKVGLFLRALRLLRLR
ncbi:dimethylaniline monooxygenase (N-oxide forming) [Yoonia tamlensis]|uniref:Trimethylamine monooxygenase n=1 Tax=Yoonia tamlensis TaxID=390270 RepID=A0A1I6GKU1_9RHOB|nr:NAD(P)-binding domain-containing protein [Yoonia tamlensis]SFR42835.1 dimethylaniline monooxygenase (N-oxide forming) [Yoonia tamlensis]